MNLIPDLLQPCISPLQCVCCLAGSSLDLGAPKLLLPVRVLLFSLQSVV
jgi:hypothetical protein